MQETNQQPSEEQEQSLVLSPEEVTKTLNGETLEPEVVLPSDNNFAMPDKFEGKSAEEIAKAYVELEKFKGTTAEPETPPPAAEEPTTIDDYVSKVVKGEELTEEDYTTIQEKHKMTKEQVDEQVEFIKYKQEKYVDSILADVGGKDLFKEAVGWAQTSLDAEAVAEFNEAMEGASPKIQKVLARSLITQYQTSGNKPEGEVLHTNTPPKTQGKGYQSQHDLLTDMGDKRYGNDRSYTQMVEEKMSVTDDSGWA